MSKGPLQAAAHSNESVAVMKAWALKASQESRGEFKNKAELEARYVNGSFKFLDLCGEKSVFTLPFSVQVQGFIVSWAPFEVCHSLSE